jgi:hypothetical protein
MLRFIVNKFKRKIALCKPPKEYRDKRGWNYKFQYNVYRKNKLTYRLISGEPTHSNNTIDSINEKEFIVNGINEPIVLQDVIRLYSEGSHLFGVYNKGKLLNSEFAYYTSLAMIYDIKVRLLSREPIIDTFYGVTVTNPNTETSLKIVKYLKDYVYFLDMINSKVGNVNYARKEVCILRKKLKSLYLLWLNELKEQDGVSVKKRLKQIKSNRKVI